MAILPSWQALAQTFGNCRSSLLWVILRTALDADLDERMTTKSLQFDDKSRSTASSAWLSNCTEIDLPTPDLSLSRCDLKVQYS
ncbi:hypothetical protein [Chamaesiphon sp. OTE_75_metabat_556]|uniref:hypothetical protein n=1 Tax=Chamaesiphon sp. OTE_75_metabat_556 TaxID=2964692 RepID=UPI00286B91EC|nr:hypothetical protein [Chamaesiphon sp. OTE_75_metabat_556]